jgi:hypothetical protein
MYQTLLDAAIRTATAVNHAKAAEEAAWHNWVAANTPENKTVFLAARAAWLQAVRDWKMAMQEAEAVATETGWQREETEQNLLAVNASATDCCA